jgi:hypothetical protein
LWSRVVGALGWGFLIWGLYMYLWAFVLYAVQMTMVMRHMPKLKDRADQDKNAGKHV